MSNELFVSVENRDENGEPEDSIEVSVSVYNSRFRSLAEPVCATSLYLNNAFSLWLISFSLRYEWENQFGCMGWEL